MSKPWIFPIILGLFTSLLFGPAAAIGADATPREIRISPEGLVTIRGARVVQTAGLSFFVRVEWDDVFLRVLLRTTPDTKILKRYSGTARAEDIKEGHILDIEGRLNTSSDTLDIVGASVRDLSLETDGATFSGTLEKRPSGELFLITKKESVRLELGTSTRITKGTLTLSPDYLKNSDKIARASGTYAFAEKKLTATELIVEKNAALYTPKNFTGIFRKIGPEGSNSIIVTLGGTDHTVFIQGKTTILTSARKPALLTRFVPGDSIRIYGALREDLSPLLDAEIIRNMNL